MRKPDRTVYYVKFTEAQQAEISVRMSQHQWTNDRGPRYVSAQNCALQPLAA